MCLCLNLKVIIGVGEFTIKGLNRIPFAVCLQVGSHLTRHLTKNLYAIIKEKRRFSYSYSVAYKLKYLQI